MPKRSATTRSAGSGTQPSCFCTIHRSAITADCCRPGGNLPIQNFACSRLSGVNAKLSGCCLARRRTLICAPSTTRLRRAVPLSRCAGEEIGPRSSPPHPQRGGGGAARVARRDGGGAWPKGSPVDLPEDDVERTEYGRDVGQHVAAV